MERQDNLFSRHFHFTISETFSVLSSQNQQFQYTCALLMQSES